MLITLIPQDPDYNSVELDGVFLTPRGTKRASKKKLTYTGTNLNNSGFDETDMVFSVVAEIISKEQYLALNTLFINNIDLLVESETALNKVFFNSFNTSQGVTTIGLSVTGIATYKSDIEYPGAFVPEWIDRTSDSYWSAYQSSVTWSGTQWEAVDSGGWVTPLRLIVTGSWYIGYRPTKVRLTYTAAAVSSNLAIRDSWNSDLNVDVDNYVSVVEADLTFFEPGDLDILYLSFSPAIDASITKIEFLE